MLINTNVAQKTVHKKCINVIGIQMITRRELKKIRRGLPRGCRKQLANETGKSLSMVNKVLVRQRNSVFIVTRAIELGDLSEEEKVDLKTKLNKCLCKT